MSEKKNDLIEKALQSMTLEDLHDYMEANGTTFKGKKQCYCPFHTHAFDSPSMSIKTDDKGEPFFHCFSCGVGGDIVKYAEMYHKLTPVHAAMNVLDFFHIHYVAPGTEVSDEEKARIEADIAKRTKEANEKKEKKTKSEARLKNYILSNIQTEASKLAENRITFMQECKEEIAKNFPHQSGTFEDWAYVYLGYSVDHKSIVIINRDGTRVSNLKYRQKYIQDYTSGMLTTKRFDGKWIGEKHLVGDPFPLTYFKEHDDKRVIICEGEKDALNLLSYGVNVLTLGGVTHEWKEHAHLLKGKVVYLWFDNDNAGYLNAIKRYYEIEPFAEDIFMVPFFSINAGLPNKYDISDFLNDKTELLNSKEDVFNLIAYSSFKLTNILIDEIEEYTELKLKDYRKFQSLKDFRDIKREWLKRDDQENYVNVFLVRGELDEEFVDHVIKKMQKLQKTEVYEKIKEVVSQVLFGKDEKIKEAEEVIEYIDKSLEIKRALLTNYRQTHIADMVKAFLRMAAKAGYTFGEYKQSLYVWTGTHFLKIDDGIFKKFIHNDWMFAARVDFKKQTVTNVKDVYENLMSKSDSLDEIKQYQKRRVINTLNGSIHISENGKVTFIEKHSKKDAATNILEFNYDPSARAPKWQRFLDRVIPDIKDQSSLMEFIGYCFLPSHKFEKFLFLYGKSGANGKSVILDTIKSFFGTENYSSLSLHQLYGHEMEAIVNKFINIGSEIESRGLDKGQISNLKAITATKDNVQINPKNDKPFLLLPNEKPKMAFSGNDKPKSGIDDAVFRRMLLISFDAEIKDDEKVRDLSSRFKDEMSGIFNMAIEGLKRLIAQNKFTQSDRMSEELEEYKDETNPLRTFIREAITVDKDYMVPGQYMYALYRAYVNSKGGKPLKDTNFWKSVKEELLSQSVRVELKQQRLKVLPLPQGLSDRARCALGIKINTDFEISRIQFDQNVTLDTKDMNLSAAYGTPMEEIDA